MTTLVTIKLQDGSVDITKELYDKSEKLKGPNGPCSLLDKATFSSIVKACDGMPLSKDTPESVLHDYFPFMKPVEIIDPVSKKKEDKKIEEDLLNKLYDVRCVIKSFNIGWFFSLFLSKKTLKNIALNKGKYMLNIKKIIPVDNIEKLIKRMNKVDKETLIHFEQNYKLITKLYDSFLPIITA